MSKKLLIYGLAFGSACAAISFVYFSAAVYKQSLFIQSIFIISEWLLLPIIAISLFFRSIKEMNPDSFTMGRAVFTGFLLSIIMSAAVSLVFTYILQFKPELIAQIIDFKNGLILIKAKKMNRTPEEIKNALDNIKFAYNSSAQFINQIFLGASRGLFFSAIIAYIMKAKINRD